MRHRLQYVPVALLVRLIGALPRPMAHGAGNRRSPRIEASCSSCGNPKRISARNTCPGRQRD
jgi:hypothetical protein